VKLEFRAITVRPAIFDKSVMMSSLMPSEKYSCSGSPDMLVNGSTAIDAVATFGCGLAALDRAAVGVVALGCHFQTRIGRSIFLTLTPLVLALGENVSLNRLPERSGLALLQLLHLVKALDEDKIGGLLDHLERIGKAA
jgi:hypothetical protein